MTAAAPNAPAHPPRTHSPLRRILAAQEFGLLAVIALMMLGLTLLAPSITRSQSERFGPGSTLSQTDSTITVTPPDGPPRTFPHSAGWEADQRNEFIVLKRSRSVDKFLNKENLVGVATKASFIAIMAVGMTGIIVLGGIDLSVGSIYALAAVLGAMALGWLGEQSGSASAAIIIPFGLLTCAAAGAACGLVNGVATVGLRVHPFIITLGGMAVYRGIAFVASGGNSLSAPSPFLRFKAEVGGISPIPMLIMLAVALAGAFILAMTVFGRRTYAIGGNETAARYAGIPVGRIKVLWFTLAGALAGLSAAVALGYYGGASSGSGSGYELSVIAAAVVGGASLSGGRGSAIGAMLGAVIIQLIDNAIVVLGIDSNYTNIVIGLAIVLAVVVDQTKHRLTGRTT